MCVRVEWQVGGRRMGSVRSDDERVDCHRLLVHLQRIIRVPVAMAERALVQSARVCAIDANRQARVRRVQMLVFMLRVQLLETTHCLMRCLCKFWGSWWASGVHSMHAVRGTCGQRGRRGEILRRRLKR